MLPARTFSRSLLFSDGKDNIDEANEFGIIVKTRSDKVKEIEKRVKEIHSYEVPCVVSFKIDEGSAEYLEWINESVGDQYEL